MRYVGYDPRVVQTGEELRFAQESLANRRCHALRMQELERDVFLRQQIKGFVHRSATAAPDLIDE